MSSADAVNWLVRGVHNGTATPLVPPYQPASPPTKTSRSYSRYFGCNGGRITRTSVGLSNRFRLSPWDTLGKDLLATTQLLRSVRLRRVASAGKERQQPNLATDLNRRPATQPAMSQMRTKGTEEQEVATHAETHALIGSRPFTLPSPTSIFHYHSQRAVPNKGPDVLLLCHGITWELHKPYIQKSHTLSSLLRHNTAVSPATDRDIPLLCLPLMDPYVTRQALARALGLLYEDQLTVSSDEVISLLAAASLLAYPELERECCEVMLRCINCHTVSVYYSVCTKYKQSAVQEACERWLQLHMVPQLSLVINLRDLPFELLEKTLLSSRLFTWNEYALFKLICHWIFLQLHPHVQIMPAHSFVVTYFQNLSKLVAFLQSEKGHPFASLFNCIRLENIIEAARLDEMERMNILPVTRMLQLFKLHHLVLHNGGDMAPMDQFDKRAARVGFIVEQELRCHVETISIYGFHFEVKAEWSEQTESFNLSLKRLRPGDPAVNMHTSEKEPVSLRASRQVCYSAELHYRCDNGQRTAKKGQTVQIFGLNDSNRSHQVMSVDKVSLPIHVTLSLLLPMSM